MMTPTPKPAVLLLAPLLAALLSFAAQAEGHAEKGQRLEITTKEGVTAPDTKAILHVLLGDQEKAGQRMVRLLKKPGETTLRLDVTGVTLPADSAERLRALFPLLKDATITLGASDGEGLPPLPPLPPDLKGEKDPAKIKAMIEKRLAAEGKTGTVNVQVIEKDGKQELRVTVESEVEKK